MARVAGALAADGVGPGDRVAGFLPNIPEAVIAMLAAASLGAVWSSCSPDFGVQGVLDRFGQIEPKVLFTADGYRYGGKAHDSLATAAAAAGSTAVAGPHGGRSLPGRGPDAPGGAMVSWADYGRSGRAAGPGLPPGPLRPSPVHHVLLRAPRACPSAWSTRWAAPCCST